MMNLDINYHNEVMANMSTLHLLLLDNSCNCSRTIARGFKVQEFDSPVSVFIDLYELFF